MKVKEFTRRMADFGTRPHVKILQGQNGALVLIYEGGPDGISADVANLSVNTFVARGEGYIEILAACPQKRRK